jgi:5-(carboxyamino)imidazole ribonucleotide synthase
VGDFQTGIEAALMAEPNAHFHWYGKSEAKPGRKMGHLNVRGDRDGKRAAAAREAFYRAWSR